MASVREDIVNIEVTLPARYNIGFSEIQVEPEPFAEGGSAFLHRGQWVDLAVAVKKFKFDKTNHFIKAVSKEVLRMLFLRHQNVLKVYGYYVEAGPDLVLKCSMVMELMDFDLDTYIGQKRDEGSSVKDDVVVYIMAEIARGMKHMHENKYAHRDLKPQNVLMRRSVVLTSSHLDVKDVKVADLGSSELMSTGQCDRTAGTSLYKAPEQFDRDASNLQAKKMDVYSFGCTCVKLWTGKDPPFKNHAGLMELWEQSGARSLPGDVKGIITECLAIDPDARPEFSKISGALDAVLKEMQVEQVPHREEVTHEEAEDLVEKKKKVLEKLGLGGVVNGRPSIYIDYVIPPEDLKRDSLPYAPFSDVVYGARWKETRYIMKVFRDNTYVPPIAWFKMLPTVSHENIVTFMGYSLTRMDGEMYSNCILMELLAFDLSAYLEKLPNRRSSATFVLHQRRWEIMKGIAEGMKYLHDKNLVHGDLKPSNVVVKGTHEDRLDIDTVKLIDFALIPGDELIFTTRYAAPEVLQARLDRHLWGRIDRKKADVYSFAITCSNILGKDEDYGIHTGVQKFKEQVIGGMLRPALPKETSQGLQELIKRCWSHNPEERPSFEVICNVLTLTMPVQECTRSRSQCTVS